MKRLIIGLLFSISVLCSYANTDSLLTELNNTIARSHTYDAGKLKTIEKLRQSLYSTNTTQLQEVFTITEKLYEEYKIFNYDSSYLYVTQLQQIAYRMGDPDYIISARLKASFIMLSAGLFKETYDSLSAVNIQGVSNSLKSEYYTLMGRYYYDLANYDNDKHHSALYDSAGSKYLDTALNFYSTTSFEYYYYSGLKNFKENKIEDALPFFEKIIHDSSLSYHQFALTASTLGGIYLQKGQTNKAIDLLMSAAIADIRSSTKETFAILNLALLLYKNGDVKHAALCIENAIANAEYYGARQRKVQVSAILPLIEGEKLNAVEGQRNVLVKYAVIVTVLVLLLIVLAYIILKQIKELRKAQRMITEAHAKQQEINKRLEETNTILESVNDKLGEANKIKEEYIGYFFNMDSEFFAKLDKLKKTLEQKLSEKKYDEIRFVVNNIDPRGGKEELLKNFDKVFLKLFPNFVTDINSLFHEEDNIRLKEGELLNTDLRIFALIRMGITDNEKIAQILDYSVKTIYAYKTKVKNKSLVPNEEFEERIMKIKTV